MNETRWPARGLCEVERARLAGPVRQANQRRRRGWRQQAAAANERVRESHELTHKPSIGDELAGPAAPPLSR